MIGLKPADFAVLIAYFVIVAGIGFLATRLIRNREDFFMGGRRFGKILTIFFSFGAGTHADDAVTVSSKSYADFFDRRYGTSFGLLYAAFGLFICVGYTGVMLFGSARVIEGVTGGAISLPTGILLVAGVSVFYGILGGLVAAADEKDSRHWEFARPARSTVVGFLVVTAIMLAMLGGVKLLADGLAGR